MGKRKMKTDTSSVPSSFSDNVPCSPGGKLLSEEIEALDLQHELEAVKDAKLNPTSCDLSQPEPRDMSGLRRRYNRGRKKRRKHLETQEPVPEVQAGIFAEKINPGCPHSEATKGSKEAMETMNVAGRGFREKKLPDSMPCSPGKKLLSKEHEAVDLHHELVAVKDAKLNQTSFDLTEPEPRDTSGLGSCQKIGKKKKRKHLETLGPLPEFQAGIFAEKINPGCSHSEATKGSKESMEMMNVVGRSFREKKLPDSMPCSPGKKLLSKEHEAVDLHQELVAVKDAKLNQTSCDLTEPEPQDTSGLGCCQKIGKKKKRKHLETLEPLPEIQEGIFAEKINLGCSHSEATKGSKEAMETMNVVGGSFREKKLPDSMPCSPGKKLLSKEHELVADKDAKLNQTSCDLTEPEPQDTSGLGCCQKIGKKKKRKHLEALEPLPEIQAGIFAEKINPGCSHSDVTQGSKEAMESTNVVGWNVREQKHQVLQPVRKLLVLDSEATKGSKEALETMHVVGRSVREKKCPVLQPVKKLLVLDINGLLADILSGQPPKGFHCDFRAFGQSVFKRPFCSDFLSFCFEKFHVGVWSSRARKKLAKIVPKIFGRYKSKLLFCWDNYLCTRTGSFTAEKSTKLLVLKELRKVYKKFGFNETNTLLLDDSPYKALRNPAHTAIFPYPYSFKNFDDSSLGRGGDLRKYLEGLADAENVQEYVSKHPFGQKAITEEDPLWSFYEKIAKPYE